MGRLEAACVGVKEKVGGPRGLEEWLFEDRTNRETRKRPFTYWIKRNTLGKGGYGREDFSTGKSGLLKGGFGVFFGVVDWVSS